ncbi:unnamed protein product [Peniophora sp. CBMAI 1063]|nr:unnamed protein product [Peniophora sp. CBMAI 1063]
MAYNQHLVNLGYAQSFTTPLNMTYRDDAIDIASTNANVNTLPFPSLPLRGGSTLPDGAAYKPLPDLPRGSNTSNTPDIGSSAQISRPSRFRRLGRTIAKTLHPRRFLRSRQSVPPDGSTSIRDSGYGTHSNILTTESPAAAINAMLGPPPGLSRQVTRHTVSSVAFAGPEPPSIAFLSDEQTRWQTSAAMQSRTPYEQPDIQSLFSPYGSPDPNSYAVPGVFLPPTRLLEHQSEHSDETRSVSRPTASSESFERNEHVGHTITPYHTAEPTMDYNVSTDADDTTSVSSPSQESSHYISQHLQRFPLRTVYNVPRSRLEYIETAGTGYSRITCVWKLDAVGNPTDAIIRFNFIGRLADDTAGKPVYAATTASPHKSFASFPKQVAIKMMSKADILARRHREYMGYQTVVCEAQTMRALSETGARFASGALATFQDADYFYIVSRWYHGSLHEYIRDVTSKKLLTTGAAHYVMDSQTFSFYAAELLLGMEELREAHILHADIKPDNIFVTPSGHLVIGDFDRSHPNVKPGMEAQGCKNYEDVLIVHSNGTPYYKAPEVAAKHAQAGVTPRADMFSLGVVLLEFALQLTKPFFSRLDPDLTDPRAYAEFVKMVNQPDWELSRESTTTSNAALDDLVFDFISKLVVVDPRKRLTIDRAKKHPLFANLDWDVLKKGGYYDPPLAADPQQRELLELSHVELYNLPPLPNLCDEKTAEVRALQEDLILTFAEFGQDWIAPKSTYTTREGPEHGEMKMSMYPEEVSRLIRLAAP